jgi:hypothetical protein
LNPLAVFAERFWLFVAYLRDMADQIFWGGWVTAVGIEIAAFAVLIVARRWVRLGAIVVLMWPLWVSGLDLVGLKVFP